MRNYVNRHIFLERYSQCIEDFEIVLLPTDIDEDPLKFFFSNSIPWPPIVNINGGHYSVPDMA